MSEPVVFHDQLRAAHLTLLNQGLADTWWRVADDYLACRNGWLWMPTDGHTTLAYPCETPRFFCPLSQRLFFDTGTREVHGARLTGLKAYQPRPSGLPLGASRSCQTGSTTASGLVWQSEGWVYGRTERGNIVALGQLPSGRDLVRGPGTLVLLGDRERWLACSVDWRPLRALEGLPPRLDWPPRLSRDQQRLAFATQEGGSQVNNVFTGQILLTEDGLPVDADATRFRHEQGVLSRDATIERRGLRPRSVGVSGRYLAGPADSIWDMRTGKAIATELPFQLGLTVGAKNHFVSVDWETGTGATIPLNGDRPTPLSLPLSADDALDSASANGEDVFIRSTFGEMWRIRGAQVEKISEADGDTLSMRRPPQQLQRFGVTESHQFEQTVYAWNEDGLLLAKQA